MRRAKKDANHNNIKLELESCGYTCIDTHRQSDGCPDMFVSGLHRRFNERVGVMVEIKTEKGKLTSEEQKLFDKLRPNDAVIIARSAADVLAWFGVKVME